MTATLQTWALPRLSQLLPLDEDSLKQIITYTDTLPKEQAAEHLKDILGDSARALEFISSFNQRRQRPPNEARPAARSTTGTSTAGSGTDPHSSAAKSAPRQPNRRKNKPEIHSLPARRLDDAGNVTGAYKKQNEADYMPSQRRTTHKSTVADALALRQDKPDATRLPLVTDGATQTIKSSPSKLPPSAAGQLISDGLSPKKASSSSSSTNASPAPKAKVVVTGGTAMHGASTALSDLDSAIRSLELQTNPTLTTTSSSNNNSNGVDESKRQCNCMATRHPLLDIAPNCLHCGKIICVKQGLGPCTFCHRPLLTADEISRVLQVLKEERGEERMRINNAAHKKADVSHGKGRAFTGREFLAQASTLRTSSPLSSGPSSDVEESAGDSAKAHRDKLLNFQANNARRTQIHDEAADYDLPTAGTNMWASPAERAAQLKRQQRVLREMEWNARPEYEKRRVVASIDVVGGKVVRRMAQVDKPDFSAKAEEATADQDVDYVPPRSDHDGAFSNNPLLGKALRPKARVSNGKDAAREQNKKNTWRRVQMDDDDNEQWILDGGLYGSMVDDRVLGSEEPACG